MPNAYSDTGKTGRNTDRLLDAYTIEKRRADHYEQQLDQAADACYDALQANPSDEFLQRISRALTS